MKQLVFEELKIRWEIIKVNTMFTLKESLAYSLNNWGGLLSTVTYMLTYLLLLSTIFGRVKSLAGYNYSEVLLFTLIAQLNFYLTWVWSIKNMEKLGDHVKTGKLDLILSKPLPHLWYITFQNINLFMLVFEMWPATIPLIYLLIKNADFQVTGLGIVYSVICFVAGHIAIHCFQFLFTLLTFWTGESKGLNGLSYQIAFFGEAVPFEGYPNWAKGLATTVAPFLIHTALTTSFVLGKTTDVRFVWLSVLVMVAFIIIKNKMWNLALRQYSSASS